MSARNRFGIVNVKLDPIQVDLTVRVEGDTDQAVAEFTTGLERWILTKDKDARLSKIKVSPGQPPPPKLVIIESPYAGDVEGNLAYAREAMLDSLRRGESPYASHLVFPLVLNDLDPTERHQGIQLGFAWGRFADLVAVYHDRGIRA